MSSIKKNYLYNVSFNLLNICIPLITTPYLTRTLGANGMGVYSYSFSVAHFFVIFILLGLNNYGCREIAKCKDDCKKKEKTFWSIYSMQLFLGIVINGIYFVYGCFISEDKITTLILSGYTLSACFDINWFFFGTENFKYTTIRNLVIKVIKTAAIFMFIKSPDDVYLYCIIMSGGLLINNLILWPHVLRTVKFILPEIKDITVHIKPNLVLFITVISVTIFKYMDKVMLGLLSDMTQVGYYEASEKIISVPLAAITSLGTVMLPRVTNMLAHNNEGYMETLHKSVIFAIFLSSVISFGIMGISREFVPLFYGEGYEICKYLYLILLPSCIFLAFANVIRTQYLLPKQMDKEYIISAILGAIVNLLINCILVSRFGAIGVAIGTLAAEGVVCIYQSSVVAKKIYIGSFIYNSIPLILSGIVMFVCLYNITLSDFSALGSIFIKIAIGAIIYFLSLFIFALAFRVDYKKILMQK
ncbi:MAG: polysaccharide biosynthesis protein [Oscillospiraceae bacterium]|nr:polysaccharide biosynthesis protein [Oscillospiraceae bacterium]